MLEIKVPSPPIAVIKSYASESGINLTKVVRSYMDILLSSVEAFHKEPIKYSSGRMSDKAIFVVINPMELPSYKEVSSLYETMGFEQAMLEKTKVANRHYGSSCPIADKDSLLTPIDSWSAHWISIFIWNILKADFSIRLLKSPETLVSDQFLIKALMQSLMFNTEKEELLDPKPPQTQRSSVALDNDQLMEIVSKCMDSEAVLSVIKKSNNNAIEHHCMAQNMSLLEVILERDALAIEVTETVKYIVSQLLKTINNNSDFFENPSKFYLPPEEAPKIDPIEESDPL